LTKSEHRDIIITCL